MLLLLLTAGGGLTKDDWLSNYIYPSEETYSNPSVSRDIASWFLDEMLSVGTTTPQSFATIYKVSVDE